MRNHSVTYSVVELHALYVSLSATPEMVLAVIDDPDEADVCQAHVFGYLQQCIGNMRNEEVRRFLCFTTGSSVLIANRISVTFNNFKRISQEAYCTTCGCVIELPSTYMSFLDFEQEFTANLAEEEYVQLANACSISHLSLFSILMLFIRLIITVLI